MTASVSQLTPRNESPLSRARRLRDEARDSSIEVAAMLSSEIANLADRCAEGSRLDTMPAGLRDALKKLAMELQSRNASIGQIMAGAR